MDLKAKVNKLNEHLWKHLEQELCRFLKISLDGIRINLLDINYVYPTPVIYKGYQYLAFDVEFATNVKLPPLLTLGNNKALGYGRIEPLDD